jgi:hypothetical protein
MSAPILPIIHMNGTSRDALLDGACAIGAALRAALAALSEHAPNHRDYYPDPPRWNLARAQHDARVSAVRAVYDAVEAEAVAIAEVPS